MTFDIINYCTGSTHQTLVSLNPFVQFAAMLRAVLAIDLPFLSVCPSVCSSHAGIVSKRMYDDAVFNGGNTTHLVFGNIRLINAFTKVTLARAYDETGVCP